MFRATPFLAWVVHLAVVFVAAAMTVALAPDRIAQTPDFGGIAHYLVPPLSVWDGGWYLWVAEEGYATRQAAAAFWPLYPIAMDGGRRLTGLPHAGVGIIVSNIAFLGALIVLQRLVQIDYGEATARRTTWLLALSPTAFFFSAVYTESIFLLLTVSALLLGRTERWTSAALVTVLATLTRSNGVVVLLPLGLILVQQRGWHPRGWWT